LYIHEIEDWPRFQWKGDHLAQTLAAVRHRQGRLIGHMEALGFPLRQEAILRTLTTDVLKSSEIEGEMLDEEQVRASIARRLGMDIGALKPADRDVEGVVEMMLDATSHYDQPLTEERLYSWHAALFHEMLLGAGNPVAVGRWRTHEDPMQVVSGPLGREKVHFEAPPSRDVPAHMHAFIDWFNATAPGGKDEMKKAPVRAALAHLYFESIHPFEDGNGRIGRVIAEKALSQTMGIPVILSLSRTIESNKKDYYDSLEQAQWSNEVTPWVEYFVRTTLDAQLEAERQIDFTLRKARFFDRYRDRLNERQHRVIQRMLEEGPDGFKGGMNARKYMAIAKTSKATATRDMQYLLEVGAFVFAGTGGGRSTSYYLNV